MKQTHCEIMDLGNDAMGIACGVSDKCNHDSDGPLLYEDKDGNVYTREEVGHMSKEDAFAIISGYSTCS
ncbi:MAG: hypothetical protein LUD74_03235, partial [Tannerellaceae bacterium]|nr:hypothetical protein [Tannerellaceae bacterium]